MKLGSVTNAPSPSPATPPDGETCPITPPPYPWIGRATPKLDEIYQWNHWVEHCAAPGTIGSSMLVNHDGAPVRTHPVGKAE